MDKHWRYPKYSVCYETNLLQNTEGTLKKGLTFASALEVFIGDAAG
jgi:hypothetical protein